MTAGLPGVQFACREPGVISQEPGSVQALPWATCTVGSALGLWVVIQHTPQRSPTVSQDPLPPPLCHLSLCCVLHIEEAAAVQPEKKKKNDGQPCGKFPTFLPLRKINNPGEKHRRNDNDGTSPLALGHWGRQHGNPAPPRACPGTGRACGRLSPWE